LQLRFAEKLNLEYIATIVNQFCNFGFDSIELLIDHNQFTDIELNNKIVIPFPTVSIIIVANSPKNEYYHYQPNNFGHIFYTDQKYDTHLSCGNISKNFFTTNLKTFTESLQYNSCLNRKISIDIDGNIKNCPSMKQSFGNIKDTTLEEAINKRGFKKYWNINKDKIKVCQDCEFRYICTDCRAYVEDPKDNYSKPLKCGYDPYTGEWSEWSTNPLKQKAIKYYGMEDLIVKNSGNTKDA
jgi:SPASM domain peptide maturase of grasp-with-spasm system